MICKQKIRQQGMMLLEALIALVVFSFGILALVGLQAAMLKNTGSSKYRSDASYIAQKLVGQMWADPNNLGNYVLANQDISSQFIYCSTSSWNTISNYSRLGIPRGTYNRGNDRCKLCQSCSCALFCNCCKYFRNLKHDFLTK
jgi:Tfp pilus assembly protein PilV